MAKRKAKKFSGVQMLVAVILTAAVVFFAPKLIHKCDDCGKYFVGTGYKPNAVESLVDSEQEVICKDCAEKQHALSGVFGGDIEKYRIPLFD